MVEMTKGEIFIQQEQDFMPIKEALIFEEDFSLWSKCQNGDDRTASKLQRQIFKL